MPLFRCCPASNNLTAFAVVTDDGSFYKLDDAGNNHAALIGYEAALERVKTAITEIRKKLGRDDSLPEQLEAELDLPHRRNRARDRGRSLDDVGLRRIHQVSICSHGWTVRWAG